MRETADLQLARQVLAGHRDAFDAFFHVNYPRLYRFALSRLDGDVDLADETAQVVLCQALSKMHTYRGEAPLFAWLCTFCRHELSKQRKARARAQGDSPLVEDNPAVRAALDSLLAESSSHPDIELYQAEIRRLVRVALDHLPALYADALESKYVHELPVREIAVQIGRSPKATESVLTRARAAFRDAFGTLVDEERARRDGGGVASIVEY